jgi:hypothetical protein
MNKKFVRIEQDDGCYFDIPVDDDFNMSGFIGTLRTWGCFLSPDMYIKFSTITRCIIIQQGYNIQKEKMN